MTTRFASFGAGRVPTALLPFFGLFVLLAACSEPGPSLLVHAFSGETMGTTYTVKVVDHGLRGEVLTELPGLIQQELDDIDSKMSHYQEHSEISQLNRWVSDKPFSVSKETLTVLRHAHEVSAATRGAFDITVGPLVDAWGFGPPGRALEPPDDVAIERILVQIGWEKVELDLDSSTVRKAHPELRLDLSAIAKGYGVDRVAEALDREEIDTYMIEVGGEVRTRGLNQQDEPWRIAIERPEAGHRSIQRLVPLKDHCLATSGDYRNYYELDGHSVSHTIDPRTGRPITHNLSSVSIVDELCVRADGLATGLLVLGPEGFELSKKLELAAYFLFRKPNGSFDEKMTTAFRRLLESDRPPHC